MSHAARTTAHERLAARKARHRGQSVSSAPFAALGRENAPPPYHSPQAFATDTWVEGWSRHWFQARRASTTLKGLYAGFCSFQMGTGDVDLPNSYLARASVQRTAFNGSGVLAATGPKVRLYFGGAVTGTVNPGLGLAFDTIPWAMAADEWSILHSWCSVPNATYALPAGRAMLHPGDATGFYFGTGPADTTDRTADGTADPAGNFAASFAVPGPSFLAAQYADGLVKEPGIWGDSISAFWLGGVDFPWGSIAFNDRSFFNMATVGEMRTNPRTRRLEVGSVFGLKASFDIDANGANDTPYLFASQVPALLATSSTFAAARQAAFGHTRSAVVTCLPRSDSTDGFITLANQTPQDGMLAPHNGVDELNLRLETDGPPANTSLVIGWRLLMEAGGLNSQKWRVDPGPNTPHVLDGTHPSALGHAEIATFTRAALTSAGWLA